MKKVIIGIAVAIASVATYIGVQMNRANNLHEYALANNCIWQYQGTMYGDNRDYICK